MGIIDFIAYVMMGIGSFMFIFTFIGYIFFNIHSYIKTYKLTHPYKNKNINRSIVKHSNSVETLYEVYINNEPTDIKWRNKNNAKFFYNHIISVEKYECENMSSYGNDLPYYKLTFDRCIMYLHKYRSAIDYGSVIDWYIKNKCQASTFQLLNLNFENESHNYLKDRYIGVVQQNKISNWDTEIIKVSKSKPGKQEKTLSNKELEALSKLIHEYNDAVTRNEKIALKLWNDIKTN